jgi:hypothetical protein
MMGRALTDSEKGKMTREKPDDSISPPILPDALGEENPNVYPTTLAKSSNP